MKHSFIHLLAGLFLFFPFSGTAQPVASKPAPITIAGSEAYELANIILALTPYGQQDQWEVAKNSRYYREVQAHFAPHAQHPLLAQVNYSRKEWDQYLSFRTDAYAFAFDAQGQLVRQFPFFAQEPHHALDRINSASGMGITRGTLSSRVLYPLGQSSLIARGQLFQFFHDKGCLGLGKPG